jgi:hypothetical protein
MTAGVRRCSRVLVAGLVLVACGARTEPKDEDIGGSGPIAGEDPREGGCDVPFVIPFANTEVRGRLKGPSRSDGWCGGEDLDDGPEDTYLIAPPVTSDVLVFVLPQTEFVPSMRVTRNGCYQDEDNLPRLCEAPLGEEFPYWHFLAEAGQEYSLTIDSPEGTDGLYALQIFYSQPGLEGCPVHPTQINQEPGGYFTWSNTLGGRQGRVDGLCGGPGGENMFQINVNYPGNMTFQVTAESKFAPVISVRTGCGATTELACTSADETGSSQLSLDWFFTPGTYFVVVDQNDIEGGDYLLEAFIE